VTTFGGSTIPVFIQATQDHSAWPSLRELVRLSLERNGAYKVMTLWRFINQLIILPSPEGWKAELAWPVALAASEMGRTVSGGA